MWHSLCHLSNVFIGYIEFETRPAKMILPNTRKGGIYARESRIEAELSRLALSALARLGDLAIIDTVMLCCRANSMLPRRHSAY